jgi:hypothetical protein
MLHGISTAVLMSGLTLASGCTGHGSIWTKPLSRTDLRDNEPLVYPFPRAAQCAYFIDENGHTHVAMKHENIPLFGQFSKVTWLMHLRADDQPKGRAMNARLLRDRVRMLYSGGIEHRRFDSRWGLLVLTRLPGDRFMGRFDITVAQQQFTILAGWGPSGFQAPLMNMWGEFEAVHDEKLARSIIRRIEEEDWTDLAGRPMTQPAPLRVRIPASAPATTQNRGAQR